MTKETSFAKVKINTNHKKLFGTLIKYLENEKYRTTLNHHANDSHREYIIDKLLLCIPVNSKYTEHPGDITKKHIAYSEGKIKTRVTRWLKKGGYQLDKIKGYDQIFTVMANTDAPHISKQAKLITAYEIVSRLIKEASDYEKQFLAGYISYCFSIIPDYINSNHTHGEKLYYITTVKNALRSKHKAAVTAKELDGLFGKKGRK